QFRVLMLFAPIGFVTIRNEKSVTLVAKAVFYDGVRFLLNELFHPGTLDRIAHRWIPDPPLPRSLGSPGADAGMRIVVQRLIEHVGEPLAVQRRFRHDR